VPADWFEPVTRDGDYVRLEPLIPAHAGDLWRGGQDDEVWRWMPVHRPATVETTRAIIAQALAERERRERLAWAIVDRASGTAIGTAPYLDIIPAHPRMEIGWTWLGRPWWRTRRTPRPCCCSVTRSVRSARSRSR